MSVCVRFSREFLHRITHFRHPTTLFLHQVCQKLHVAHQNRRHTQLDFAPGFSPAASRHPLIAPTSDKPASTPARSPLARNITASRQARRNLASARQATPRYITALRPDRRDPACTRPTTKRDITASRTHRLALRNPASTPPPSPSSCPAAEAAEACGPLRGRLRVWRGCCGGGGGSGPPSPPASTRGEGGPQPALEPARRRRRRPAARPPSPQNNHGPPKRRSLKPRKRNAALRPRGPRRDRRGKRRDASHFFTNRASVGLATHNRGRPPGPPKKKDDILSAMSTIWGRPPRPPQKPDGIVPAMRTKTPNARDNHLPKNGRASGGGPPNPQLRNRRKHPHRPVQSPLFSSLSLLNHPLSSLPGT